jgi:hypothetical protein
MLNQQINADYHAVIHDGFIAQKVKPYIELIPDSSVLIRLNVV